MALAFHPNHLSLINELHSRPSFSLEAPCSIVHLAVLPGRGPGLTPRIQAL